MTEYHARRAGPADPDAGVQTGVDAGVVIGYPADRLGAAESELLLGPDPRLRSGTVIYAGSRIGARLATGHHVVIREQNSIGDDVSIWTNSVVDYGCHIGNRVKIHCNCYVAQFTRIDDDAFLAPGVTVANDLYPGTGGSRERMSGPRIGARARIGVNATLLPFVQIGAGALIGSGSVVTRDVPPGAVAYGSPAKVHGDVLGLRDLDDRLTRTGAVANRFRWRRDLDEALQ